MFTLHNALGEKLSEHDDILTACDVMDASVHATEMRDAAGRLMRYTGTVKREPGAMPLTLKRRRAA